MGVGQAINLHVKTTGSPSKTYLNVSFWVKEGLKYSGQELVDDILLAYLLAAVELWSLSSESEKASRVSLSECSDSSSEDDSKRRVQLESILLFSTVFEKVENK